MTKREKYLELIKLIQDEPITISKEKLIAFCQGEIDILDKKLVNNKKRAALKPSPLTDELSQNLLAVLGSEPLTISEILLKVGLDASYQHKVAYRLSKIDSVAKSEVKIRDNNNRLVPRVAYALKEAV